MKKLDTFTLSYIQTALWSSTGHRFGVCPCCGKTALLCKLPEPEFEQVPMCDAPGCGVRETSSEPPLDDNYTPEDITPATLAAMAADCAKFQSENETDLSGEDAVRAGHDFWLTRNHHGAGFWDGDWEDSKGERFTASSKTFGEFNLYPGDDGKLYN